MSVESIHLLENIGTHNSMSRFPFIAPQKMIFVVNMFFFNIIFYLQISRYSSAIYYIYQCQNYHKTKSGTQR